MISHKINSLDSLQKRKKTLLSNIEASEYVIFDTIQELSEPFKKVLKPDNSIEEDNYLIDVEYYSLPKFAYTMLKTVKNVKRINQMFQLGKAVFFDYKKK
ncbi:hypothetical protein LJC11_02610 [Bacteroidales bacterium OttesenSCG-928-I21]|nr:hypothetical protein [Bacteroidales bacterium OttesenSCG-928-I21]